jgi:hypothetical protein
MLGACLPGVPQHLLVGQELPEWQARARYAGLWAVDCRQIPFVEEWG